MMKNALLTRAQWKAHWGDFLLCAASGLFGGVIFRHDFLGIFAWMALAPFFIALTRMRGKPLVYGTLLFGFLWYYLSLWWLHTLVVFHWIIPLGVLAGSLYMAAYFLLFAFSASYALRNFPGWLSPWALAVFWVAVEYLHTFTDMAFPWNFLGHSQAPVFLGTIQTADKWGVYGVSFTLALANALIANFAGQRRPYSSRVLNAGIANCIAWGLILGASLVSKPSSTLLGKSAHLSGEDFATSGSLKVAVIQPNISQLDKWDALMGTPGEDPRQYAQRFDAMDKRMRGAADSLMREAAAEKPQLYVLPESTFLSGYFTYQQDLHQQLQSLARELNGDLFFGADNRMEVSSYQSLSRSGLRGRTKDDPVTTLALPLMPTRLNDQGLTVPDWSKEPPMASMVSAWQVKPETGLTDVVYNKVHLVPFGEMVPFVQGFAWLRDKMQAAGIAGAFHPGMEFNTFETSGVRYGTVICFESTFSSLTGALSKAGAQLICVQTNDAWYDPQYAIKEDGFWGRLFRYPVLQSLAASGPDQHFAHSVFRAIETRLPVVRSANSGISAIINSNGKIEKQMPYGTRGQVVAQIPVRNHNTTFYTRYGDWFAQLCLAALAMAVVAQWLEWIKARRRFTIRLFPG